VGGSPGGHDDQVGVSGLLAQGWIADLVSGGMHSDGGPLQPFSLEAQDKRLRSYIASQDDWHLIGEPNADQASGATLDRPQLNRMLTAARAGRFDVLLVYRVDRIARSLRGLVRLLDDLDKAGVVFGQRPNRSTPLRPWPPIYHRPPGTMPLDSLAVSRDFVKAAGRRPKHTPKSPHPMGDIQLKATWECSSTPLQLADFVGVHRHPIADVLRACAHIFLLFQ